MDRLTRFVATRNRGLRFPGRGPYKRAIQLHYLYMVLLRVFRGEALERIDTAQAHRKNATAQHFRPSLVALVQ